MKRFSYFMLAALACLLVACNQDVQLNAEETVADFSNGPVETESEDISATSSSQLNEDYGIITYVLN